MRLDDALPTSHKSPLVVFSHLRWDHVYQRPQQIMSRVARSRRVFFVEEPVHTPREAPRWELSTPAPNLLVCKPHVPEIGASFAGRPTEPVAQLVAELLHEEDVTSAGYVFWLYTPMAVELARLAADTLGNQPLAVVYDCMDELASFSAAPKRLRDLDAQLMGWAGVVFTGGPSLYRARVERFPEHSRVYCFPSSVDVQHFADARSMPEAADQRHLPHPRLGFYGVVDERMDLALLDAIAGARPHWQIVIVGPFAKIDEEELPRRSNLHYLGQRTYEELPTYLAGWDVCLLPFALNEATRYISPTKTLEYMAAGLPIVSTPIADVARPYGEIVYVGEGVDGFLPACDLALDPAHAAERQARIDLGRHVLESTSWDRTVHDMETIIDGLPEGSHASAGCEGSAKGI